MTIQTSKLALYNLYIYKYEFETELYLTLNYSKNAEKTFCEIQNIGCKFGDWNW